MVTVNELPPKTAQETYVTFSKLKLGRVEVCLNCRKFLKCGCIGMYEECADFVEVEDEAWVIRKV